MGGPCIPLTLSLKNNEARSEKHSIYAWLDSVSTHWYTQKVCASTARLRACKGAYLSGGVAEFYSF